MSGRSRPPDPGSRLIRLGELQQTSLTSWGQANLARLTGDFETALEAYQHYLATARVWLSETIDFNREAPQHPFAIPPIVQPMVDCLLIMADLAEATGRRVEAPALRGEAERLVLDHLGAKGLAALRRQQAATLAGAGHFNAALVALTQASSMFADQGDVLGSAQATLDLASILSWLGDHERSLQALDRSAGLVEDRLVAGGGASFSQVIEALNRDIEGIATGAIIGDGESQEQAALWRARLELREYEAFARRDLGDLERAERLLREVLPRAAELGTAFAIEFHLASIMVRRGRHQEALSRLDGMAQHFDQGLSRPRRAALRLLQADAELGLGAPAQALRLVEDGLSDQGRFPDLDLGWKLEWRKGKALRQLGQHDSALNAMVSAGHDIDMLRKAPLGYRLDSSYLWNKLELFDDAIALAAELNAAARAAELMELVKARALSATLSVPRLRDDGPLAQEFDDLSARLDAIEYAGHAGQGTIELRQEHDQVLARRRDIAEQIRIADPRWRVLSAPPAFDLDATLAALVARDQAALSLYLDGDRVVAVLLQDGEAVVAVQAVSTATRQALDAYRAQLLRPEPDYYLFDLSQERDVDAGHLVPPRLLERALRANSLVFVPHRELHLVPWAGLMTSGTRLFERTAVGVLPNLTALTHMGADAQAHPRIALLGDPDYAGLDVEPLRAAGEEIAELARLYEGRHLTEPLTRGRASEQGFWQIAARAEPGAVLHVTCHATAEVDDPMRSGLLLTESRVDAGEIARRGLGFDEVVLSACSTGWRPQTVGDLPLRGDDVLGLPGALLEAGASCVLVSIPPAEDAVSREFVVRYHRLRAEGTTPLAACNATQRQMLDAGEHDPALWVGFVLYGCR